MLSQKRDVRDFLEEVRHILDSDSFDAERDFQLIINGKDDVQFSTPYTLLDLEFDSSDVIKAIRDLSIEDYSETLIDRDDDNPPYLFVFGKTIGQRTIYIKLKVKARARRYILCVSFHYAKHEMPHPYA